MRIRAIICCLIYGLLPWWCYERRRHYACSWGQHLLFNLGYAARWALFREDESDRAFEARVNSQSTAYGMLQFCLLFLPFLFAAWHGFTLNIGKGGAILHAEVEPIKRHFQRQ